MVVDTSAIVAILFLEPDAARFESAIASAPSLLMSAVTRVELSFVIESRKRDIGRAALEAYLEFANIEIVPVDLKQMTLAIEAYRAFGKGRHKASLNIGDCFAYALAKSRNDTLLYNGTNFALTDIAAAA